MANQEDVARGLKGSSPKKKQQVDAKFASFNPSREELKQMKELAELPLEVYAGLEEILATSLNISLQGVPDEGAYKVLVYDKDSPFQGRLYVSMFASTPLRALCMLVYAWRQGIVSYADGLRYARQIEMLF